MDLRLMFGKTMGKKKKKKKKPIEVNLREAVRKIHNRNKKYKKLMDTLGTKKKPNSKIRY